jgi:very-short-patch-repair endonuclease
VPDVDRLLTLSRVMHRRRAALLSSRATLSRRVASGWWWRPTSRTVSPTWISPDDPEFAALVAAAHVWPGGGLAGTSLAALLGFGELLPTLIDVSVPATSDPGIDQGIRRRRSGLIELTSLPLPSGRRVTADIGPASLAEAARSLNSSDKSWLILRALNLSECRSKAEVRFRVTPLLTYLKRHHQTGNAQTYEVAQAIADGCQSAGEVCVWHLLRHLRVRFQTQVEWRVPIDDKRNISTQYIACDFVIEELKLVLEVDSRLHDHLNDVRRDLWVAGRGYRTLRIVGLDVVTDPAAAKADLIRALRTFGWRGMDRSRYRDLPDLLKSA